MFPETKWRETLRFEGNKIHCSQRDQFLSDLLYSLSHTGQLLNPDWRRQRAFFLNHEGTFGNQEGMIT